MHQFRALILRLRGLFAVRRSNNDVAAELEGHIALHIDDGIRAGLSSGRSTPPGPYPPGRRGANPPGPSRTPHLPWLECLIQDTRYGLRMMVHNPGFTAVAVLTLAIGIGASTAIFSAIKPILIDPLPYPHASRLMMLWEMRKDGAPMPVTFGTFQGLSQRSQSFDALAVFKPWQPAATATSQVDRPERIAGQRVSADYFRVSASLRSSADFQASDDRYRGPNVVILSDSLWRRRFAADLPLSASRRLDDALYTVIGVMPRSYENVLNPSAEIWAPLQYDPSLPFDGREWGHHLRLMARSKQASSSQQAGNELSVILHSLAQTYAKGYDSSGGAPDGIVVHPMQAISPRACGPRCWPFSAQCCWFCSSPAST
jgi:hypothetical protein